jgi:hypothetical protein
VSETTGDGTEYGLVMPFVVCASNGGPYDDEAFVVGYQLGILDTLLAQRSPVLHWPLRTASMPQVDLIAMRYGYTVKHSLAPEDDYWTMAEFVPGPVPADA